MIDGLIISNITFLNFKLYKLQKINKFMLAVSMQIPLLRADLNKSHTFIKAQKTYVHVEYYH